jgi:SAM-dependent methyltransferase
MTMGSPLDPPDRPGFSFSGRGPGARTPDGCSVDLYRQMPYLGELDDVFAAFPAGASVLELGCGTGRLSAALAGAGHRVTGVDESADMLTHLPASVAAVCSPIEALALPRRFGVVLLAGNLIHHPNAESRAAFAACARRHLESGGLFFLERHDPAWLETVQPGRVGAVGPLEFHVEAVSRETRIVRMTLRYEAAAGTWWHSFEVVPLDEPQVEALLQREGFTNVRWFGRARQWASAVAA